MTVTNQGLTELETDRPDGGQPSACASWSALRRRAVRSTTEPRCPAEVGYAWPSAGRSRCVPDRGASSLRVHAKPRQATAISGHDVGTNSLPHNRPPVEGAPEQGVSGGRDRRRSGDLTLFSCVKQEIRPDS